VLTVTLRTPQSMHVMCLCDYHTTICDNV